MKKTVRRRYNKDGSITKTTTYRHKNIFGTTVSDTYTERINPKERERKERKEISPSISLTCIGVVLLIIGLVLTVTMIKEGAWRVLIISIPLICIGFSMLPIDIPSLLHRNETAETREVTRTANGWICPDCETENSNSSSTCKGCGRYK